VLLADVLHGAIPLIEIRRGRQKVRITFGTTTSSDKEGELSLNLEVDGNCLFILFFTVIPGRLVKSQAANVLLITRIQGTKGSFSQISTAPE
jgi:uncharacterized protein VirK/YbjX